MSDMPLTDRPELGVWLVGAAGEIAATAMVGASALTRGLVSTTGLTTAEAAFAPLRLRPIHALRFGGVDIGATSLRDVAMSLSRGSRTVHRDVLDAVLPDIAGYESDVLRDAALTWDTAAPAADLPHLQTVVSRIREAIAAFQARHGLERVVVVNLMSAAPEPPPSPLRAHAAGVESLIEQDRKDLMPPSACYAWAAVAEGCPYINFTPNAGTDWGGLAELAQRRRVPFYGDDGKTGETLLKTALAHMFALRNLRVLSWEGVNLLGNNDGRALEDPRNREMKLRHKRGVLDNILGYSPHAGVTINYVPSLGDWKTAWDLIHFEGFMDVPMTMQFTWQGCDSILAAPLVLDLARLADFAARQGEHGPMPHLAAFFKHPLHVDEMDLQRQFGMLMQYIETHRRQG